MVNDVEEKKKKGFLLGVGSQSPICSPSVSLPVPTFASFLKEVESPYEVHDYVRAYLGDTFEAKDFAKQFLERRAKQNTNQQKPAQNQQQALKQQQVSEPQQTLLSNKACRQLLALFFFLLLKGFCVGRNIITVPV